MNCSLIAVKRGILSFMSPKPTRTDTHHYETTKWPSEVDGLDSQPNSFLSSITPDGRKSLQFTMCQNAILKEHSNDSSTLLPLGKNHTTLRTGWTRLNPTHSCHYLPESSQPRDDGSQRYAKWTLRPLIHAHTIREDQMTLKTERTLLNPTSLPHYSLQSSPLCRDPSQHQPNINLKEPSSHSSIHTPLGKEQMTL